MSTFEDGQQEQQQTLSPQSLEQPHTPLRLANEASSKNNNSIMGKVKLRVSSIFPGSLGKWFSPTTEGAARADSVDHSPSQQQQQNGSVLTVKRKRSQRRIELEADDAPDIMDDGYDAQDLNDEEVQLADNIAEHDLVAEDEQTRRNEYNLSLLRKRQMVAAAAAAAASRDFANNNNNNNNNNNDDDDEDDDDLEDEEDDEQDDDVLNYQQQHPNRNPLGFKTLKPFGSSNATAHQPPAKRTRFEQSDITFSPQFNARRRPQLHASTPAVGDAALRTQAPPNRLAHLKHHGHLKLYGQQREPAFNFLAAGSSSEAAVATSGDLPMSSRRSLNIPPLSERRESLTTTATMLPSYKRQSLLGQHGLNMRNCSPISEVTQQQEQQQQQQTTIIRQETNNNNNNNNIVISAKQRATDSHSECESNESQHVGLGLRSSSSSNNNIGNNSNLLFYGNLQSRKSVFNANAVTPQHHNSTLSLNSLNNRRRFNASIYGSTSALSDSRLLSSSLSTTSGSPFYHGPTAFGGNSANNRYFSQGNLANIINSGGSSPAPSNSDSNSNATGTATPRICFNYQMKPVEMRPNKTGTSSGATNAADTGGLSQTAQRILNLLENHTTPLMDAKKMGSTLREHQQQRSSRHTKKPYSYPTAYGGYNHSYQTTSNSNNNTSNSNNNNTAEQDNDSSKLLVPTMLQLLERRRLQRVTTASTRQLINAKQQQLQLKQQQSRTTAAVATNCAAATGATVNSSANSSLASAPHTNKMRSRLSHQTRKDARNIMDEQLPPPPIDLPDIRFPTMAQEPKFELSFKSTATSGTKLNSIDCSSSNINSIKSKFNANNNYNFEAPLPINNSLQSYEDDSNNVPQKRVKHNFVFVPPKPLEEQQQQEQLQQKERSNDLQLNGDKSLKTSGSVMDILVPKTTATPTPTVASAAVIGASATSFSDFGERFKKPAGNWECDACMVSNKAEAIKCIACETPKKTAAPKATATVAPTAAIQGFAGFGNCFKKPAGNWECDACMVSNKAEAAKCIACETPRKNAAAATTAAVAPVSATFGTAVAGGFGDAFKPKANTWQCDTCMITNQSKDNLCVACQTPNPKAKNTSSSTATTAATTASSFSFGFGGKTATTPKPDAGFQQLIAAQKSSSWTCEVCTAQNDVARNKCICCEQLKPGATAEVEDKTSSVPKFMFGFSSSTAAAAATTAAASATATVTASTAAPFKFGFAAAGKDVADKADNATTTTTATTLKTSLATATTPTNLKFGAAAATPGSKTVAFKLSEPQQMQEQQKQQQQTKTAEAADTTAPVSSKAPATSSIGLGLFTPAAGAATSTAATLNKPAATFAFGSSNLNTSTATTTAATPTAAAEASSKLFSFGSFTGTTSTMSSNSGSNTTTSSSSNSNNSAKPAAPIFSFGASSSLQQPAATTSASSTMFGQPSPLFAAAVAGKTGTTTATAAVKTVTTPAAFVFGSQANIAAATTSTNTASSNTSNFFFGSPATPAAAGTTTTTTAATTTAATPVAGNNMNLFSSSSLAKSSSIAGTPSTTPIFSFGSGSSSINNTSGSSAFTFGSKPATAATVAPPTLAATTTTSGGSNTFGWPTAAAAGTAATPTQFASFGSVAASSAAATTTTNATPFSSSGLSGGSGALSSIFGNVSNPFNNSSSNTAATPAPMSNIFNTAGTGGSNNSSTTTVAAATTTSIDKPIFQFGAATAPGTASTEVFNFGGGQSNPSVIAKPAFNFSGAGATTQPQTAAFNFTGSVGANVTGSASSGGNNNTGLGGNNSNKTDLFPTTERLFQFGAPAPTTVNLAAAGSGAGESSLSSSSSSIVPAAGQLFNFTGSTQQMQLQSAKCWQQYAKSAPQNTRTDASFAAAVETEMAAQTAAAASAAAAANVAADNTRHIWTRLELGLERQRERDRELETSARPVTRQDQKLNDSDNKTFTTIRNNEQLQREQGHELKLNPELDQQQRIPLRTTMTTQTTNRCMSQQNEMTSSTTVMLHRRSSRRLHELQQLQQRRRQQQKQRLNKYRFVRASNNNSTDNNNSSGSSSNARLTSTTTTTRRITTVHRVARPSKYSFLGKRQGLKSNSNHNNEDNEGNASSAAASAATSSNVLRSRYKLVRQSSAD